MVGKTLPVNGQSEKSYLAIALSVKLSLDRIKAGVYKIVCPVPYARKNDNALLAKGSPHLRQDLRLVIPREISTPAGIHGTILYLLYPDSAGDWTIGVWDGTGWYDLGTGEIVSPQLLCELPSAEAAEQLIAEAGAVAEAAS